MTQIIGNDYIGGVNYRQLILRNHPIGWAAGFLAKASGWENILTKRKFFKKLINRRQVTTIKVAGRWYNTHNFSTRNIREAKRTYTKHILQLADLYPQVTWLYNPWLEHNAYSSDVNQLFDVLYAIGRPSNVKFVNNPVRRNKGLITTRAGLITELHHADYKKQAGHTMSFSYDGKDCFDMDITENKKNGSKYFWYWQHIFNLKYNKKDSTSRERRTLKPTSKHFRAVVEVNKPKNSTSFSSNWLYKSHAEAVKNSNGSTHTRSWKPLLILPYNNADVRLGGHKFKLDKEWNEKLPNGNTGWIYRASKWAFEISTSRQELRVNGQKVGTVQPNFREGWYIA